MTPLLRNRLIGCVLALAIFALDQRTHVGRKDFGQHRDHAVGKIDRIAAFARFLVQAASRTDIERYVRDRDDGLVAPLSIGFGPDRVIVVPRVGRIDGDDGDVPKILALLLA